MPSASELRFYLYKSISKVEMLYEQLFDTSIQTQRRTVGGNIGLLSGDMESTTETVRGTDEKIRAIEVELQERQLIGTIDAPKDYFHGTMTMRWGLYNDQGARPDNEPALVYFGGFDKERRLVVGLGGSTKHVVGHEGATSTYSRSATPALVKWLIAGMKEGSPPKNPSWNPRDEKFEVFSAMAIALHYLGPPTQNLEFVAKTLTAGTVDHCEPFIGISEAKTLLGTPLWVALVPPFVEHENRWGLDDGW